MRIRLQYPPKGNPFADVANDSNYNNLIKTICQLLELKVDEIILKMGFPPSTICADCDTIISTFLQNGDSIFVQKKEHDGTQAHTNRPIPKSVLKESQANNKKSIINTPESTVTSSRTRTRKKRTSQANKPEDWAENIVQIFSQKSNGLNSAEKALKGVFKNAVQRRYRSTQAEKRWASVQGSSFTMELIPPHRFSVSYANGPRSKAREQYIALPKELMKAVIEEAYSSGEGSKMNLRPYYLAEAQPLIFWNMIRLFDGDIKKGFTEILPNYDWSFIDDRHRELSEKAKENIRQKKESDEMKEEARVAKKARLDKKFLKEKQQPSTEALKE